MKKDDIDTRKEAIEWWNSFTPEEQFIKLKETRGVGVIGGRQRLLRTLTGSEIEMVFEWHNRKPIITADHIHLLVEPN